MGQRMRRVSWCFASTETAWLIRDGGKNGTENGKDFMVLYVHGNRMGYYRRGEEWDREWEGFRGVLRLQKPHGLLGTGGGGGGKNGTENEKGFVVFYVHRNRMAY